MKTIVVPTDFSAISLNAVNYAADLACVIGTRLSLMHVVPMPITFGELLTPAESMTEMTTQGAEQLKQLAEKMRIRTDGKLEIATELRQGDVVAAINDYCNSTDTYAVVMGVESTGVFERFLFGGKTFSAMEHLSWPLIIVPPGTNFEGIKKIGLACDLHKVKETVPVDEIKSLLNKFQAEFHVLYISDGTADAFNAETIKESLWLRDLLGVLHPTYHFIGGKDIEESINEFAKENAFDFLIIIPRKHTLINKIFQHSYSKNLVLHTQVPVLAIHE